jgi:hypothetical protein
MRSEEAERAGGAIGLRAPIACVLVSPYGVPEPDRLDFAVALREQCAQATDRVAWRQPRGRDWPDAIFLSLGPCALSEAQMVCEPLMSWLTGQQLVARMGIGSTQTIAQLAAQSAAPGVTRAVAADEAQGFIQRLAALAQGADLHPLQPSPAPARVAVRLRFSAGATPDQALTALPRLAAGLVRRLEVGERQGRALRLGVVWESGAETWARRRLARPLCQPGELTQAAHALLSAILAPSSPSAGEAQMAALSLSIGDLSARLPAQQSVLFDTASAARSAVETAEAQARLTRIALEVAEPLARRYGTPRFQAGLAHCLTTCPISATNGVRPSAPTA